MSIQRQPFNSTLAAIELGAQGFPTSPIVSSLQDFLCSVIPPRELILAPWLPMQGLAMVHAPRGIGKTHFSLGVAYAAASAGMFLGWKAPQARGVMFIDGEMPAAALQERLAAIVAASEKEASAPFNVITPDLQLRDRASFNLGSPEDQDALEYHLDDVDLIVVDNIATLCRIGKENEAQSWLPIQEWALRQRASGRSVLFIHHSGKGGQQRGTSSREDVLDTVINLKRPCDFEPNQGARFEVHFEKARGFHGDEAAPIEAQLTTDANGLMKWSITPLEDSIYTRIIELHKEGCSQKEIADEVGRHKSNVSRMLRKARDEGLVDD